MARIVSPPEKQLIKCNMNTVVTMAWDPRGKWQLKDNGVLILESRIANLTLHKINGMRLDVSFSEGDLRRQRGDWLSMYVTKRMEVSKSF